MKDKDNNVWNAIWCSRHQIAPGQLDDLIVHNIGEGSVKVIATMNITWCASRGASFDIATNIRQWKELAANAHIILGVFPPVALEALREFRKQEGSNLCLWVFTPVSEQHPIEREDGSRQIEFRHVRWCEL